MKTLTLRSEVGDDGRLRLEVACDLPPGPVEVVVVVHPAARVGSGSEGSPLRSARSGLFVGKASPSVNLDTINEGMNALWKGKLADLEP